MIDLLKDCSDEKWLRGDPVRAKKLAERAYNASEGPALRVWHQLAAYRLGHLILRTATSREQLAHVNELFLEAAGDEHQTGAGDPLASVYRLAVIQRLMNLETDQSKRAELERDRRDTMVRVRRQISGEMPMGPQRPPEQKPWLNDSVFDMLELAAYFTGEPFEDLYGLSPLPFLTERNRAAWVIVSNVTGWGKVYMTRELAELEFATVVPRCPGLKVFYRDGSDGEPDVVASGNQSAPKLTDDQARFLAILIASPGCSSEDLQAKLDSAPEALRQRKKRLNAALKPFAIDTNQPPVDTRNRLTDRFDVFVAIPARLL